MLCTWLPAGDKHKICFLELSEISSPPFFFFFFATLLGILEFPWPEIEPVPPALQAQSLNRWTTKEVLFPQMFLIQGLNP